MQNADSSSLFDGLDAALQNGWSEKRLDVAAPCSNLSNAGFDFGRSRAQTRTSCKDDEMSDLHKITEISVLTKSTEPLVGIVQVNTADTVIRFEITEDVAHKICTDIERFLTR